MDGTESEAGGTLLGPSAWVGPLFPPLPGGSMRNKLLQSRRCLRNNLVDYIFSEVRQSLSDQFGLADILHLQGEMDRALPPLAGLLWRLQETVRARSD